MIPFQSASAEPTARPCTRRTTILLIRHASTAAVGILLASRARGIRLTAEGRAEARRLCAALARVPLTAVFSSPLERALDTARPIATSHGLDVDVLDDLNEINFGEWSGLTFDALDQRADWQTYNRSRSQAVVPAGEPPVAAQTRVLRALADVRRRCRGGVAAVVSHAELIRYVVLHREQRSLDDWHTVPVDPASITRIVYREAED
jgi:broad specificity phosphatase PhoE